MKSIQLIGGKLQNKHYVVDTGDVYQIKQLFGACETFVKQKNVNNGSERMIYIYVGMYHLDVTFNELIEEHKDVSKRVISINSITSTV